jgi:hypothetical protein
MIDKCLKMNSCFCSYFFYLWSSKKLKSIYPINLFNCVNSVWSLHVTSIFLFGQERNFTTFFNYYLLLHHFPNISSFIISLFCIYNLFSLHPSYQSKIKRHQFHFISLLAFNKNILWSYFVYHFFKTFQTV